MPGFKVSTIFTAKDKVSAAFKKMRTGAKLFGDDASKAFNKASKSSSRFADTVKGFLTANILMRGFQLLASGIRRTVTEFIGFDQAITSASAKFKGLNLRTKEGQATLQKLKDTARATGAQTQFSSAQAASGLNFLAMAGFNAKQAMASLAGVVDLATVADVDLGRATDIATDSLGAFGLMTKDATQLQINFIRMNDVMALTMARTNTGMEDLFEVVKKGAPVFINSGQSLESFNALLGIMADSGVKASEAGTGLRNIMLRLAGPTGAAKQELTKLGIKTKDSKGNFLDIMDIIGQFEKSLKGMGTEQRAASLKTIFGSRAITGFSILLKKGTVAARKFRKELLNSAGASKKMADIMRQSLANRIKSLQSALIELGFQFFTAFEKKGGDALDAFIKAARKFDMKPIIEGVKSLLLVIKGLFNLIKVFTPIMIPFIAAWGLFQLKLLAISAQGFIPFLLRLIATTKLATVVQWLFNKAFAFSGIGTIIIIIGLVIAAIALLIIKWKAVTKFFKSAGLAIWDVLKGLFGTFKSIFALFGSATSDGIKAKIEQKKTTEFIAPNKEEARAQQVNFNGRLDIAGAPEGSKISSKTTGAPNIGLELLGANI